MITEVYVVVAILCSKTDCWRQNIWHGTDRMQCMAEAVKIRVNPPVHVNETKMSACLVERERPGYEWTREGYWRKVKKPD